MTDKTYPELEINDPAMDREFMDALTYEDSISSTVRTIGRDTGTDVVFQGDGACIDGNTNTVYLPANPDASKLTKKQVVVGRGFSCHETLHKLCTDLDAMQNGLTKEEQKDELLWGTIQALEDIRIERCGSQMYDGMAKSISMTCEHVNSRIMKNISDENMRDLRSVGPLATTWVGRKRLGYPTPSNDMLLDRLPPKVRETVEKFGDMAEGLRTVRKKKDGTWDLNYTKQGTHEVIELARQLVKEMRDNPQPDGPGGEEGEGEEGEGNCTGQGGKGEGQKGKGQGGKPNNCSGDDGEKQPGEGEGEGEGQGAGRGDGEGDGKSEGESEGDGSASKNKSGKTQKDKDTELGEPELGEDTEQTFGQSDGGHGGGTISGRTRQDIKSDDDVKPISSELNMDGLFTPPDKGKRDRKIYQPFTRSYDKWHTRKDKPGKYTYDGNRDFTYGLNLAKPENIQHFNEVVKISSGKTNTMRRKLERMLMAKDRRDWSSGFLTGQLDRKRLVKASQLKTGVFRRRDESDEVNTAVQIVIDLSGSMYYNRIRLAEQAAIAILMALEMTGAATEVVGFDTSSGYPKSFEPNVSLAMTGHADFRDPKTGNYKTIEGERGYYSRYDCVDMYVFKDFNETLRQARPALGAISSSGGAANCDGESVLYAWQRLKERPEPKKIMLVMSDGYPAFSSHQSVNHINKHLRDVVEMISQNGAHIVGIGIQSDAVKQFYPRYTVLHNIEDLPKATMDHIGKLILGERFVVDNADLIKSDVRRGRMAGR